MIEHYEFGKYIIDGREYEHDITLINDKVGTWRAREHSMFVDDIMPLVENKPEIILIGTGFSGMLTVKNEVIAFLKEKNIPYKILKTRTACDEYNKLIKEGKKAAAILHGTC